jgi:Domain of unknown function (DUF397)
MDLAWAEWRKSTQSSTDSCVEVAFVDAQVAVRDSKHRDGAILLFTPNEWEAFIGGVRHGEFDLTDRGAQS